MVHNAIQILFTGQHLEKEMINTLPENWTLDKLPFIETHLSNDSNSLEKLSTLAQETAIVVITSQIAVDWATKNIAIPPNWTIACMQGQTQKALNDKGWGKLIQHTANNSLELAKKIEASIQNYTTIHFLGSNQRLENLPKFLNEKGYNLNEMIAYTTISKQQIITKQYDGIVFLSPSAVYSFFNQHAINEKVILFTIGQTTAAAIQKNSKNKVVVADGVSQSELFKTIINYYQAICH